MKNRSDLITGTTALAIILMLVAGVAIKEVMTHTNTPLTELLTMIILAVIATACLLLAILFSREKKVYDLGYAKAKREDVIETYIKTLPTVSDEDNEKKVMILDSFNSPDRKNMYCAIVSYCNEPLTVRKIIYLREKLPEDCMDNFYELRSGKLVLKTNKVHAVDTVYS